ncbi:MAG TPA: DMT family transporter [Gaiellaceae bacterium]|nr:DMT family transporter [Gaiellaceae bacterium]
MSTFAYALNTHLTRRAVGIALAFVTALVSGVAVFLNSYGVKHFGDATVYTTAKNAVAALVLLSLLAVPAGARSPKPLTRRRWLGLLAVATIGGSIPFILFFEGLARADATQAAFIQKTLVIWVALLAVPLLHERLGLGHLAAIAFVIAGQAWLAGDPGTLAFGAGEAMIVAATLLWACEVIVVKRLLAAVTPRALAAARMGIGTLLLIGWLAASGRLDALVSLSAEQWRWAVLTGLLLSAYVGTWYAALARAQAVDVTAVLVLGAVVTALLDRAANGVGVDGVGVGLICIGAALAVFAGRPRAAHARV